MNKKIIIVGGSSGIGLAIAEIYCKSDNEIILISRNQDKLDAAILHLEAIKTKSCQLSAHSIDIGQCIQDSHREIWENVDILIYSAGLAYAKEIDQCDENDFLSMMNTNLLGAFRATKRALIEMRKSNAGKLVYINSVAGHIGIYGYCAYSASKFALEGFTQSLRNELAATNIDVVSVYPPDTDTPMLEYENRTKPNMTKKISGGMTLSAEFVASEIVNKIQSHSRVYPGFWNRVQCFLMTHFRTLIEKIIDSKVRKASTL